MLMGHEIGRNNCPCPAILRRFWPHRSHGPKFATTTSERANTASGLTGMRKWAHRNIGGLGGAQAASTGHCAVDSHGVRTATALPAEEKDEGVQQNDEEVQGQRLDPGFFGLRSQKIRDPLF